MKICLFRAFPDPFRKSMQIYADQLLYRIRALLNGNDEIVDCLPAGVRTTPGYARYWDQYVRYQLFSRSQRADVHHVIDHGYGHLLHSLPARQSIVTFHDSTVTKVANVAYTTKLSLRYSLQAIRKVARVIADSESSRRDFLDLVDYPEADVVVIYPGIDDAFRPLADKEAARRRLGLPVRYVLHVGHTLAYMNVEHVLLAFDALVHRLGVDVDLVKVGATFTAEQESLIDRLSLRERIRHLGNVAFADLPAIYNCADALVYPPLYAGFGLPPVEAMACGVPVVCSDRGSLPEVVGDAALMVDAEDNQLIAEQLARALTDNRLCDDLRHKGLARARRYNWNDTARGALKLYREVALA